MSNKKWICEYGEIKQEQEKICQSKCPLYRMGKCLLYSTYISNYSCSSKNDLDFQEIWLNLYRCRDLELKTLWTRSTFLWMIIVLAFTGYGFCFAHNSARYQPDSFLGIILCLSLSFIIFISGLLAFFMAKGSKYWYELYENKIQFIEENCLKNSIPPVLYNSFTGLSEHRSALGLRATRFSPSKINIVIGLIIISLGSPLFIAHFVDFFSKYPVMQYSWQCQISVSFIAAISILVVVALIFKFFLKSKEE